MIARVVPLVRLPNIKVEFDYEVPSALESNIAVGQLVSIPFRKSECFGLVLALHNDVQPGRVLKTLSSIMFVEPLYTQTQMDLYGVIAQVYRINISTVLLLSMSPLQKTKLKKMSVTPRLSEEKKEMKKARWLGYDTVIEHAQVLEKYSKGYTLIVVPTIERIDEVFELLPQYIQDEAILWHAELTEKEKFEHWWQIRNGQKRIIIGTRSVVMLPFFTLNTIILDYEHDAQHKQSDQAPRYHSRDMVLLLARVYGAQSIYTSFSPSTNTFFGVHKGLIEGELSLVTTQKPQEIISIEDEWKKGMKGALAESVHEHIASHTGNVLCYINRTGFAQAVVCKSCHQSIVCSVCGGAAKYFEKTQTLSCGHCRRTGPLPPSCPSCQHPILHFAGIGTERLEKELKERYGKTHRIVRIDATVDTETFSSYRERTIFIGTRAILSRLPFSCLETIVYVDVDSELQMPEFLSHEEVWHTIESFNYYRTATSTLFLQTHNPKHIVIRSLSEKERWYRTELQTRKVVSYPPYFCLVKYCIPGETLELSKQSAQRYFDTILATLTEKKSPIILERPFLMSPSFAQRRHWHGIVAHIPMATWVNDILFLNSLFAADVKIDPNPVSLLGL